MREWWKKQKKGGKRKQNKELGKETPLQEKG